jgi:hypothetical protein
MAANSCGAIRGRQVGRSILNDPGQGADDARLCYISGIMKVTTQHYPADRLPDDLRGDIAPESRVTVTVEAVVEPGTMKASALIGLAAGKGYFKSEEDMLAFVNAGREE